MRWTILWTGKQESGATVQSLKFKQEELESIGELSEVCSQIVLKCLYLGRIGRPDILWSVNKHARSVTKWTHACHRRLQGWFLTLITQTISDNIVIWETRHSVVDWVCFKIQTLLVILRTQKSTPGGVLCMFWKLNIMFSQLDVQETDCCFAQFHRIWSHSSGCWIAYGWVTCSWSLGHSDWSSTFNQQQGPTQTYKPPGNGRSSWFQNQDPTCQKKTKDWSIERGGLRTYQHTFFSRCISVVHLWGPRSRDQNDN